MHGVYEVRVHHGLKTYEFAIPSQGWEGSLAQLINHNHPLNALPLEVLIKKRMFIHTDCIFLDVGPGVPTPKPKTTQTEQFDMNAPVIQEITQYRGRDIKGLSNDSILDAIRSDKKEIKSLQDVGVESSHITAKIETLTAGIARLVAELDSRG